MWFGAVSEKIAAVTDVGFQVISRVSLKGTSR